MVYSIFDEIVNLLVGHVDDIDPEDAETLQDILDQFSNDTYDEGFIEGRTVGEEQGHADGYAAGYKDAQADADLRNLR